ncbi:MAG: type IX secretion system membrane protein PorP/SprF [Bacteroidota bacterium]
MRKFLALLLFFVIGGTALKAQQDAMFTKYMFNSLVYNPAYAGYYDHMYISALYRNQWLGIDGAPVTQTLTLHTPLKSNRVGVGFNMINDAIGPIETTRAFASYSYKIPLGGTNQLAIGIQGGINYRRGDRSKLNLEQTQDNAFIGIEDTKILPNFGTGIMFYNKNFYFGVSSPSLIEHDLRDDETIDEPIWAKEFRHYYLATGAAIPLNGDFLIFKPSILVKNVGLLSGLSKDEQFQMIGGPTEFDIDLSLLFYEQFQVGLSFRSAVEAFSDESSYDSADIWMSFFLPNGLRIGAAFDYPLNDVRSVSFGSFEVMVGYEFDYKVKKTVTPRYF